MDDRGPKGVKLNKHAREALKKCPRLLEDIGYTIPDDSEAVDAYLKEIRENYPELRLI